MTQFRSEIWKPIPNYEGLYEASSLGRIRSCYGKTTSSARFKKRVWKSRIMKTKRPYTNKRPNKRVTLWKDGVPKDFIVSRLIAMAFHGLPSSPQMTVNHIDGNWENDTPDNLEWITREDNIKIAFQNNLYDSLKKPVTLISEDGKEMHFESMSCASRYLGRQNGYVSGALKKHNNVYSLCDGKKYSVKVVI